MIANKKLNYGWLIVFLFLGFFAIGNHYGILNSLFRYTGIVQIFNHSILAIIAICIYSVFKQYHLNIRNVFSLTLHTYVLPFLGSAFFYDLLTVMLIVNFKSANNNDIEPFNHPYLIILAYISICLAIYIPSTYFLLKKIFGENFNKLVILNYVALTFAVMFIAYTINYRNVF
jgi:hypothetical protein